MAHAQKPDIVFRRNGRVHLNRLGASVQSNTGSPGVRISGSNAGYNICRGSVKSTGYTQHSPVSPSLPQPCITVCHHISTGVYWVSPDTQLTKTLRSFGGRKMIVTHLGLTNQQQSLLLLSIRRTPSHCSTTHSHTTWYAATTPRLQIRIELWIA